MDDKEKCMKDGKMGSKRAYMLVAVGLLASLLFIIGVFYMDIAERNRVHTVPMSEFVIGDPNDLRYVIESYSSEREHILVQGWAVLLGKTYPFYNYGNDLHGEAVYNNIHLACIDKETGNVKILPTQLYLREDVTEAINDGINYQYAGFRTRAPKRYEDNIKEDGLYIVSIEPDGERKLYEIKERNNTK